MLGEARFRAETLFVTVNGVGEPDGAVGMDDHVVGTVEGAGMVVIYERGCFVRSFRFHVYQACGFVQTALGAKYETVFVIGAAVDHVVALGAADLVTGEVCRGEEFDFGNDDGFVGCGSGVGGGVGYLVGGYKEGGCGWVINARFVKVWGAGVGDEKLEGRRGAEEGEEGVVVDVKGPGLLDFWGGNVFSVKGRLVWLFLGRY